MSTQIKFTDGIIENCPICFKHLYTIHEKSSPEFEKSIIKCSDCGHYSIRDLTHNKNLDDRKTNESRAKWYVRLIKDFCKKIKYILMQNF